MKNRQIEDTIGVSAARRRFLVDLTWPESTEALCQYLGLLNASEDVQDAEKADSEARMRRFVQDDTLVSFLVSAASDMEVTLRGAGNDPAERVAWLATYALAIINLLESQGRLAVLVETE